MSLLGPTFRFQIFNDSGATSGAITVDGKRWKFDSANDRVDYEDTEAQFLNLASLADGAYGNGSSTGNDTTGTGYFGGSFRLTITGGTAAGDYTAILQQSTDGGTTWPDDGEGRLLGVFNVAASTTETFQIDF